TNSGLLDRYGYATTTTATDSVPGDVAGMLQWLAVQQGQNGNGDLQEVDRYYLHTAGGVTVTPLAMHSVYGSWDPSRGAASDTRTTYYSYTWFAGTTQEQSMAVALPVISGAQNGSDGQDSSTTVFNTYGQAIWTQDSAGFLNYSAYDVPTGAVVKRIVDVDTTQTSQFTGLPSGWSTPAGGGLNLVTQIQVDALGRTTKLTDANGNVSYTVYDDRNDQTRIYAGWNSTTNQPTGPTKVVRVDRANGYTETLTMSAPPNLTNGAPDGTEAIANLQTLSRDYANIAGQVVNSDAYFNLSGVTYSTSTNLGAENVNFYRTRFAYDSRGRENRTVSPAGTITRTVYNGLSEVTSTWVGTNDTPASGYWS